MKDSSAKRLVGSTRIAAAAILCLYPLGASAQQTSKDSDVPAIYYFPETQPAAAVPGISQHPVANPQSNYRPGQAPSYNQYGAPGQTPGGYGTGAADVPADADQPIEFDTNAFCEAPDATGKIRSAAWVKNCISAATVAPDATAREPQEQILQQQLQNAGAAGQHQ
ncbi:hypothetical protein ACVIGB_000002 [Bradyrhizobium sp. USDA 4341]